MSEIFPELATLLQRTVDSGASDLHVSGRSPSIIRAFGVLREQPGDPIPSKKIRGFLESKGKHLVETLDRKGDVDFSITFGDGHRFRINAFREREELALAIRLLSADIPSMDDLSMPEVMQNWAGFESGLVIITGPTGSGKSTSVAAMVNEINFRSSKHIVTIEDPVEYVFPKAKSTIRQREIGVDAFDFASAVKAGLREDVDVMVVGEMRDLETISAAINVAETGHLVFATLHTSSAPMAIDRMINAFEPAEQQLVRSRLASCLLGVVYQRLLPATKGGRTAAFEILVGNSAVRNLIREAKTHQIPNIMSTSRSDGMQLITDSLNDLLDQSRISEQDAQAFAEANFLKL